MQGNNGVVMRLNCGGPPLLMNTQVKKYTDKRQNGVFSEERCITYLVGKRFLSLKITKICKGDCVNLVYIHLTEQSGKGSSANLTVRFIRNDRYGVLCSMNNQLSGSYELVKQNYCVPPLADAELALYYCRETGDGSCFTLEKKKGNNNSDVVERVKGTHAFLVGDETLNVILKITNDTRVGLRVQVDGPIKLTRDYSKHVCTKIEEKMESEIRANVLSLFRNATGQLSPNGNRNDPNLDSDDRMYVSCLLLSDTPE